MLYNLYSSKNSFSMTKAKMTDGQTKNDIEYIYGKI
jgi:hypothetical protein